MRASISFAVFEAALEFVHLAFGAEGEEEREREGARLDKAA